jgi:hypothetical protein
MRSRFVGPDGTPQVPDSWPRRPAPASLPHGVTLVSVPVIGTSWHERGAAYWQKRVWYALLLAATAAAYVALYALILWDDHHRNGYSTAFWVTGAVMLVLTAAAAAIALRGRGMPFRRAVRSTSGLARAAGSTAQAVFFLVLYLLTPGLYLAGLTEALRREPSSEWAARADLEKQLAMPRDERGRSGSAKVTSPKRGRYGRTR